MRPDEESADVDTAEVAIVPAQLPIDTLNDVRTMVDWADFVLGRGFPRDLSVTRISSSLSI